ncbi:hypothetical protein BG004_000778, partial [Podila humilis]
MAASVASVATFTNGRILYIQYRKASDDFGRLFAIDTTSRSPNRPTTPSPIVSQDNNSTATRSSFVYTAQNISASSFLGSDPMGGRGVPAYLSMVAVVSSSNRRSHDLLLAYSFPQKFESTLSPFLLRYTSTFEGDDGQPEAWVASSANIGPIPTEVGTMRLALGSVSRTGNDGTAYYQLLVGQQTMYFSKLDTHGNDIQQSIAFSMNGVLTAPQIIALSEAGRRFNTVVVGACAYTSGGTCLTFVIDDPVNPSIIEVRMAGGGNDEQACYTSNAGSIVRITTTGVYTYSYLPLSSIAPGRSIPGVWFQHQPPSGKARITSALLACTSTSSSTTSTLYAVAE